MARSRKRKSPRRRLLALPLRKRFVISTEGKTELEYFGMLNRLCRNVTLCGIKPGTQSAPRYVLKRMKAFIKTDRDQSPEDQYWLVTDKNSWNQQQLRELFNWSRSSENFGFSVSNPKFEYWLLLHFEDGHDVSSPAECSRRLKRYLPDYDKSIDQAKFTLENIAQAVQRAKRDDSLPCSDWPRKFGTTTVYKLVQMILESSESANVQN